MFSEDEKFDVINSIKTSMEMENQNLTNFDLQLLNSFADNKISIDEAIKSIKEINF